MFKNYLRTALRNLRRQRTFTLLNLIGMALGIAGFIILAQGAGTKLNADRFHKNADRIYGLVQVLPADDKGERHTVFVPAPLLAVLEAEFPEIETGTRIRPGGQRILRQGDRSFYERDILFADPAFLSIFSFPLVAGNPAAFAADPRSVILSESAARKYFRDEDPIGQALTLDNTVDLTVRGVVRSQPKTSSFRFDVLIPFDTLRALGADLDDRRADRNAVFLLAKQGFDEAACEAKLPAFVGRHLAAAAPERSRRMYLLPLLDFRLKSSHIESFLPSSQPGYLFVPLILGVLLLLVVGVNFINLSTVRHLHRLKEVGVRKVVGARRLQIVGQLVGESVLLACIALPLAVLLYEIIQPIYARYMKVMAAAISESSVTGVSDSILNYPYLLKYALLAALLTGILSGLYPALFLTSFRPVQILKGSVGPGRKKRRGSRFMVVCQFTAAVVFVAFAGTMRNQTRSYLRADFGFDRERVATLAIPAELGPKVETLQTEIARLPQVVSVSASAGLPLIWTNNLPARPSGEAPEKSVSVDAYGVGYGFVETLGLRILDGRSFSRAAGGEDGFIINEAAAGKLGWKDPVGRILVVGERTGPVIGVARDFLFDDLGFAMPPAVLMIDPGSLTHVLIKYSRAAAFPALRDELARVWNAAAPGLPLECSTLEDRFERTFEIFRRLAGFLNGLGLLIVLLSCLGLLGLAAFTLERRTKEVGIRKVLGASLERLSWSLGREFFILVAIANVVGLALITVGWRLVMRTGLLFISGIGAGTYVTAVAVSFAAAFLAVATQTVKAGRANPVDALKAE